MRNIFDQYVQPENRITHALMTALNEDRDLLRRFISDLLKLNKPNRAHNLTVLEQQYPGELQPSDDEAERRGIPDGWIFDEDAEWCVLIESKVLAPVNAAQILNHLSAAKRLGFEIIHAVVIAPRRGAPVPAGTLVLEWRDVYGWLRHQMIHSRWAARVVEYLEIAEAKLVETGQFVEGTLTMFSGFPFGHEHPFTYFEGKRILRLAMSELRGRRDLRKSLGVNPNILGRTHIKGRHAESVWDYLSMSGDDGGEAFTRDLHLTLGVNTRNVGAVVTVPHAVNGKVRKSITSLGEAGFRSVIGQIMENLRPLLRSNVGAIPMFRGIQRRYPSQSAPAFIDAELEFDLRTAIPTIGPTKAQPRWLSAAYGAFVNKENSNYQIQIGAQFPYEQCPAIHNAQAVELIAGAWLACKPLIDLSRP